VFSVVHAVLIRSLPYADAERIVFVRETFREQCSRLKPGALGDRHKRISSA
jgi:hypothetical protein